MHPSGNPLIQQLASADRQSRRTAAYQLTRQPDPAAVPALLTALQEAQGDSGLTCALVKALGYAGDPLALDALNNLTRRADTTCVQVACAKALERLGADHDAD
ncbi:MAG: hypothetical protein GYB68_19075 [Chloroflexi bacterium]|nr:hypothetical protein [Chloroflexota bacterium]